MNELFNLTFPGNPQVSTILGCIIHIGLEVTVYALIIYVLKYYIPGAKRITRIVGIILGSLIGIFAAKVFTYSFISFYPNLQEDFVSAALIAFAFMNAGLTTAVYSHNSGGPSGPTP